jgi:hypothetical protein
LQASKEAKGPAPAVFLKIINPNNAGGEVVLEDLDMEVSYAALAEVKKKLLEVSSTYTTGLDTQFGFICPGHGTKGRQKTLNSDDELASMYLLHKKKKRIYFWLKCSQPMPVLGKRSASSSAAGNASQPKRHAALVEMMTDVDTIIQQLRDKHGQKYSDVQYSCWAHMLHTNKHHSLETAPNKPFFGKKEPVGVSPSKRISLRTECIDQLDKWSKLMERGVISDTEYGETFKKKF